LENIGIKYQLRITTLIPTLLVTLLFALFYNGLFGRDLNQYMLRLGDAYIRQLMPAAQFAMLRKDDKTLQGLINASTINPEVKALAFYSPNGQLLAYKGGKHTIQTPFTPSNNLGDHIESKQIDSFTINFVAPITLPKFNLYSNPTFADIPSPLALQADDVLGWLSLDIDTQSILIKRYQMVIVTIIITLLGLLLSLTMHYFLSKRIYVPIIRLRRSMKQILNNAFETEIQTRSGGDLGTIEKGCAHLQKQYLDISRDLNQHIETATTDLQQSLELLEEKNVDLSLEKKKADERNRQKSEFIANMSHEIRTPMNGVIGFANVLLETKLDHLQFDYVNTIKSSAQDLLSVINDILDFTKIDAGKLQLDCIPFDIRGAIDEVLTLAAPNAYKKGVDLIPITVSAVPKTVLGDPLRIKQIISNLVTNAIKFTEQGHVLIRTTIDSENDSHYVLAISVSDTGIGISPADQSKLFTAFSQADTSITRRYGGSGLGLVLCKKLCETMQGRISLTSEIHKGSNFTAFLKLEKLQAYEIEKNQPPRFADIKALCFDTNPLHLEALCNALEFWEVPCLPISTFKKLASTLKSHHKDYSIAFINVDRDEEQNIANLMSQYPKLSYVLLSRFTLNNYLSMGAKAFLHKPINMLKLQNILDYLYNKNPEVPSTTLPGLDNLREQLRSIHPDILVAEDNAVNQMLLRSLLGESTHAFFVENGEQAIAACSERKFTLLLLDLYMPKVSGIEVVDRIRKQSNINKDTPVILLSANDRELSALDLKNTGIDYCLSKPFDEKQLLIQILRIINNAKNAAIDWQLCVQKVSGNQALAEEYLTKFIEELHKNRAEFLALSRKKNKAGLAELAHKLHGACCFCGVPFLQKKVMQLETTAPHINNFDELSTLFAEVIQCIDAVISEYENKFAPATKPLRKNK
jgi:two-component system sensor histidine kinase BarA